jgi:hypothetical protein
MTSHSILQGIPGGAALFDWFGRVPRFHDAKLLEIALSSNKPSTLRIHAWEITDQVDPQGYFVLDKNVVVTITLHRVMRVALSDFSLPAIIGFFEITKTESGYQLAWDVSYGVEGSIAAEQLSIELSPGIP